MPPLIPIRSPVHTMPLAMLSGKQRFKCCTQQEGLQQWMYMYAAFSNDNPESMEQIIDFLLELIHSNFSIRLDATIIKELFEHSNGITQFTQFELVHRIHAIARHQLLIQNAIRSQPCLLTTQTWLTSLGSEQVDCQTKKLSNTQPTIMIGASAGFVESITTAAIHMIPNSTATRGIPSKDECPEIRARMLIDNLESQSTTLSMFLGAGMKGALDSTTPTLALPKSKLVSVTRLWLFLRQKLHLKQVRDDDSIWDRIQLRKLFDAKCLRLSLKIWKGITRSIPPAQSTQLQKWHSLKLDPLTTCDQIPPNLPMPMIQILALKGADRTVRTARYTNCRTVFVEWRVSTTQSISSTRRSLGFGVLIDWATSMRKRNFINTYVNLNHTAKFHREYNHVTSGYLTMMGKKGGQQSFGLLLAIQQVTTNSTWFAVSCIPKIRAIQSTANIRHIQVKNSPASIIAAVACGYAVRHSFERQINGHAPQPGLTLPLHPEIASLVDELSSIGVPVRQVVPSKNGHPHKTTQCHDIVNTTRLVLTELKRVLTIRGAPSSMTSSNNLQSLYNSARDNKWLLDSEVDDTLEIPRIQSARLKNYQVTPNGRHRAKYSTGSGDMVRNIQPNVGDACNSGCVSNVLCVTPSKIHPATLRTHS